MNYVSIIVELNRINNKIILYKNMIKAFLSHSSADKDTFVRPIAQAFHRDEIVFDELTFESGEQTLDEISKGLQNSALFVLFISDSSLNSKWVKKEIFESKKLNKLNNIKILPIVIDQKITHTDHRIPSWLKKYNLKPVTRIKTIINQIKNKLILISWEKHPKLEEINKLFIGRHEYVKKFEEELITFNTTKPIAVFTSGLSGVGRRTFMYNALLRTNLYDNFLHRDTMSLDRNDSIEDFILKLNDFNFLNLEKQDLLDLSNKSIDEKINIIKKIFINMSENKDILFILDDGCLVNYKREISPWLLDVINQCASITSPFLFIASYYRIHINNKPRNNLFSFFELHELNAKEREMLLIRLMDIEGISGTLSSDKFLLINNLLTGLPEQIKFAIDLIKDKNIINFEDKLPKLSLYNTEKATVLLRKYENNEKALDFIRLLAELEVSPLEFTFSITGKTTYINILEDLVYENICELTGIDNSIIRLNDIIRDYIKRNRRNVNEAFIANIKKIVEQSDDNDLLDENSSVYSFKIKEKLKNNQKVDDQYIIPSHFLRCMKDLYNSQGELNKVIELADKILIKESYMEHRIIENIRYYLCLALAKKGDDRFKQEVFKIHGDEHTFLFAFYYRKCGKLENALTNLKQIVNAPYVGAKAKREIVQVYTQLEEYDEALEYAKNNHNENPNNIYHCHAYFNCLINSNSKNNINDTLLELLNVLENNNSELSQEMFLRSKALYTAKIENDFDKSISFIEEAINMNVQNPYPLFTKCEIALFFKNVILLETSIESLKQIRNKTSSLERTKNKYIYFLLNLQNKEQEAKSFLIQNNFPELYKEKLKFKKF